MRRSRLLAALVASFLLTTPLLAGVDRWTDAGPDTPELNRLVADPYDPNILYAGGPGVFRSLDGGESWHRLTLGLPLEAVVDRIAVDASTEPSTLYAGVHEGHEFSGRIRIYASTNGGRSWHPLDPLPPLTYPCDVAVVPTEPATLLVFGDGIYRSMDRARTWQRVSDAVFCAGTTAAWVDPGDVRRQYVSGPAGLLRSMDGGRTWSASPELPGDLTPLSANPVPSDPGTLYALSQPTADPPGLWRSSDGGDSWQRVPAEGVAGGLAAAALSCGQVVADVRQAGRLWAACEPEILVSDDAGVSWSAAWNPPPSPSFVAARSLTATPHGLFAIMDTGLLISADGGASWQRADRGIAAGRVEPVLAPSDPAVMYALVGYDVYRSEDLGESWKRTGTVAHGDGCVRDVSLVVDPVDPNTVYSAGQSCGGPLEGLARSRDGGRTWTGLRGDLIQVTVAPADPSRLLAINSQLGVELSEDGGATWSLVLDQWTPSIAWNPADPLEVYLAGGCELYASRDGGRTWDEIPVTTSELHGILGVVPGDPPTVFLSGGKYSAYLLRSRDRGATWQRINGPENRGIWVVPSDPPVFYSSTPADGALRSSDAMTWTPIPEWEELLPSGFMYGFWIHPSAPSRIFRQSAVGLKRASFVGSEPLLLGGGRFEARAAYFAAGKRARAAHPRPLADDTGAFWFFRPGNLELMVKLLDGGGVNGYLWTFQAALTHLGYEITFVDTATGLDATLDNPPGTLASRADLQAIPEVTGDGPAAAAVGTSPTPSPCFESALCFHGRRFRVEVEWRTAEGDRGAGQPVRLTPDSGAFWFFRSDNLELVVKLLDGRAVNGHYWLFWGGLTNVEYTIHVLDLDTGLSRRFENRLGELTSAADTRAFPAD